MALTRKREPAWHQLSPPAAKTKCSPGQALLVDVSGNRGDDILSFCEVHPDMTGHLILQDLPETIDRIDPNSIGEIELQSYDIFTPQSVTRAKIYLWHRDDLGAVQALSNKIEALDEDSRLLIYELILPDAGADLRSCNLGILEMLYHSGE